MGKMSLGFQAGQRLSTLAALREKMAEERVTLSPQHSPRPKPAHLPNLDACTTGPGTLETQWFKQILKAI